MTGFISTTEQTRGSSIGFTSQHSRPEQWRKEICVWVRKWEFSSVVEQQTNKCKPLGSVPSLNNRVISSKQCIMYYYICNIPRMLTHAFIVRGRRISVSSTPLNEKPCLFPWNKHETRDKIILDHFQQSIYFKSILVYLTLHVRK